MRLVVWGGGLAAAALLAAGCGTGGIASAGAPPDLQNGQALFLSGANGKTACAACHTLAAAGSTGTIGPNLDFAFAWDRKQGYAESTIENVVLDQIRLGSGEVATYTTKPVGGKGFTVLPSMPANLVTGQNAIDVAAYVASVAGLSGSTQVASPSTFGTNGETIFKGECAGCHTLAAAGTHGTVGPNLDQLKPAMAVVAKQVTNGGGVMPSFKGTLSAAQIQAVARYVSSVAGKK